MNISNKFGKSALLVLILGGFLYPSAAGIIRADSEPIGPNAIVPVVSITDTALIATPRIVKSTIASLVISASPALYSDAPAKETRFVRITAYSSTPEETDDTPFTTAMNTTVRDGIIAANFLPFGTKVRIPSLFGQKVFVVEDRMHPRMTNVVDVWMPSKQMARQFGLANTQIEILQ